MLRYLKTYGLSEEDLAWVAGEAPAFDPGGAHYGAKTRYRQADAESGISRLSGDHLELRFSQPQWAVTPGQSAVLYRGEVCLGGGVIQ